MKKEILFKEDVRKKMFTGLETVYNAVSATLGPRGHLACIERGNNIDITKTIKTEGEDILSKINSDDLVITLEIEGKMISSVELAEKIQNLLTYGRLYN